MSKNPMAPYVNYIQWANSCIEEGMSYAEYAASAKENDKIIVLEHEYAALAKTLEDQHRAYMGDE